jgi:spoIIIJ-associated protein
MNAYERHVVHTALQDNPGVSTYSVGSEPNRRVVVAYGKNTDNNYVSSHTKER